MSSAKIVSDVQAAEGVAQYVDKVLSGDIVAGPSIRAVCQRHRDDLKKSKQKSYPYCFDAERAGRMINFFPVMLTLRSGKWDGEPFVLFPWQEFMVGSLGGWVRKDDARRRFQDLYLQSAKNSGKEIADDTPVLTANRGWTTHGELRVGDSVFGVDGAPTDVVAVHAPRHPDCYRLRFACGGEVVSSASHLWKTRAKALNPGCGVGAPGVSHTKRKGSAKQYTKVRRTDEIYRTRMYGARRAPNHAVPASPALQTDAADLPVPPYALGVWLGDGSKDRPYVSLNDVDAPHILARIEAEGIETSLLRRFDNHALYRVDGLRKILQEMRVMIPCAQSKGDTWKHIPDIYLCASFDQRLELLRGLLDTDGTVGINRRAVFTNHNPDIIRAFVELVRGLGYRPYEKWEEKPRRHAKTPGCSVQFVVPVGAPMPFTSPRQVAKIESYVPKKASYVGWNAIRDIAPTVSVSCRCITVAAEDGMYLVGRHLIPTHNSPLVGGLALYLLIADGEPAAEVYLAASDYNQAGIVMADVLKAIESNDDLNERLIVRGGDANPREITYKPQGQSMSIMRRVANNSTGKNISGFRPSAGVFDEVAFWKSPDMLDAMRRGGGKRAQPLMLMLTNAGTGIDSIAWPLYQHGIAVAHGDIEDNTHFPLIFDLDKTDDVWNDESCWAKANPSYPVLPTPEALRKEITRSKSIPGERNAVRRMHFNEWVSDASQYFLGEEAIDAVMVDSLDDEELKEFPMTVGLDLSRLDDLTAAAQVWKVEDKFYVRVNFWVPDDGLIERAQQVPRLPWDVWAKEEVINATEGKVVDYSNIVNFLTRMRDDWNFRGIAFDDWRSDMLFREFQMAGISLHLADREGMRREPPAGKIVLWKHPQGFNRSNPTRQSGSDIYDNGLKSPLWMSESIELLKNGVKTENLIVERNPCLRYNMLSVKVVENDSGGMRFTKSKSTGKIDGVVAMAMGIGLANAMPELSTSPRAMLVG